jgi:5-methylcytosine-specific restriction endonuclease McrA
MDNISVLKLDSSFKPLEIISWEEAFLLTWLNKAWAVEYSGQWVHSATKAFQVPSIIVLFRYIEEKFFTLPCTRMNIMIRDEKECQYCLNAFRELDLTIDHVIPRSKGGKTVWTNVVMACKPCNQQKRDLLLENTTLRLRRRPQKPSYRSIIKKRIKTSNFKWKEYL